MKLLDFVVDKYNKFCERNNIDLNSGPRTYLILNRADILYMFLNCNDWNYERWSRSQLQTLRRYYKFCIQYAVKNNVIDDLYWFIFPKDLYRANQADITLTGMSITEHYEHYKCRGWDNLPNYISDILLQNITPIHINQSNLRDYFVTTNRKFRSMLTAKELSLISKNKKYNCLDVNSDGKVTYIPFEKVKLVKNGRYDSSKLRQVTTIGKILNHVDPKNEVLTKQDIERISNKFSAIKEMESLTFEVWEGELIKKAYLVDNYAKHNSIITSTLHNSCMRHFKCQSYMDFYIAAGAKIAVLLTKDRKIAARALLWKVDDDLHFLDRIYSISPFIDQILPDKVKSEFKINHYKLGSTFYSIRTKKPLKTSLKNKYKIFSEDLKHYSGKFPYLDTFCYYFKSLGLLTMSDEFVHLRSTNGHIN